MRVGGKSLVTRRWALEVDDGDHGGDEADNIDGPSVGC
jgi:hypothetical protein